MIGHGLPIYVALEPVDMRLGAERLGGLVRERDVHMRELQRNLMQAHFDARSAQEREVEVEGADGVAREQVRRGSRTVATKYGEVELGRKRYQAPGVDGLVPLDAAMELAEDKYSYEVRRIVAEESTRASFDEVVELVQKQRAARSGRSGKPKNSRCAPPRTSTRSMAIACASLRRRATSWPCASTARGSR